MAVKIFSLLLTVVEVSVLHLQLLPHGHNELAPYELAFIQSSTERNELSRYTGGPCVPKNTVTVKQRRIGVEYV